MGNAVGLTPPLKGANNGNITCLWLNGGALLVMTYVLSSSLSDHASFIAGCKLPRLRFTMSWSSSPAAATAISSCMVCHKTPARSKCGGCLSVSNCSKECAKKHWPQHKKQCVLLAMTQLHSYARGRIAGETPSLQDIRKLARLAYRVCGKWDALYLTTLSAEAPIIMDSGDKAAMRSLADKLLESLTDDLPPELKHGSEAVIEPSMFLVILVSKLGDHQKAADLGRKFLSWFEQGHATR